MRKSLLLMAGLFMLGVASYAQTILFTDNFESGITNWTTTGAWGLSTTASVSPTHSLSESPSGNYLASLETYCTMNTGVDLSTYPSATLEFQGKYKIEDSFDYMYVEISTDNFVTHVDAATYTGDFSSAFALYSIDLGGYCGSNNVKVRFHFSSDTGLQYDGMYIDDFTITGNSIDNSPPLIIHTPLPYYEGTFGQHGY